MFCFKIQTVFCLFVCDSSKYFINFLWYIIRMDFVKFVVVTIEWINTVPGEWSTNARRIIMDQFPNMLWWFNWIHSIRLDGTKYGKKDLINYNKHTANCNFLFLFILLLLIEIGNIYTAILDSDNILNECLLFVCITISVWNCIWGRIYSCSIIRIRNCWRWVRGLIANSLIGNFFSFLLYFRVRGRLGSLLMLTANSGILLAFIVGHYLEYVSVACLHLGFPLLFLFLFVFFPDTPFHYIKTDNLKVLQINFVFSIHLSFENVPFSDCSDIYRWQRNLYDFTKISTQMIWKKMLTYKKN